MNRPQHAAPRVPLRQRYLAWVASIGLRRDPPPPCDWCDLVEGVTENDCTCAVFCGAQHCPAFGEEE